MLATTQRLRRSSDFATVIRSGRRAGRGTVVVHLSSTGISSSNGTVATNDAASTTDVARPEPHRRAEPAPAESIDSPARAGFVVSKAVGNAVVRNTVRRRLRHLVAARLADLPAGTLLVVRAQPSAAGAPAAVLAVDLDAAIAAARSPRRRRPPATSPRVAQEAPR